MELKGITRWGLYWAIFVLGYLTAYYSGDSKSVKTEASAYFTKDSDKFLNGIKLDLPEEIGTIRQQTDSTLDLLTGYLDTDSGIIYLGFSGKEMNKYGHLFITEHSQLLPDLHEYQLDLEMDSVYLYDHGRFVGKAKYGNSQLDSLFMTDNQ